MTCEDCLSALATESLREMTPDSAVMQHCATCPDCARVTTALREKEYETATVLNGLPPMSNPLTVAETAVRTSQRRRIGRVVVMLSAIAGSVIIWMVSATILIPAAYRTGILMDHSASGMRTGLALSTETIPLSCLSPKQAADLINPYVRGSRSMYFLPASGISAITVRGTASELAKSRSLIARFERDPSAACHVPATTAHQLLDQPHRAEGEINATPQPAPNNVPSPSKKE